MSVVNNPLKIFGKTILHRQPSVNTEAFLVIEDEYGKNTTKLVWGPPHKSTLETNKNLISDETYILRTIGFKKNEVGYFPYNLVKPFEDAKHNIWTESPQKMKIIFYNLCGEKIIKYFKIIQTN